MISTDGSITEYVCVYGNNGNVCEPGYRNLRVMGVPQGPRVENGKQQTRLLVYNTYSCHEHGNDKERLINSGFYDLATAYQSVHVNY